MAEAGQAGGGLARPVEGANGGGLERLGAMAGDLRGRVAAMPAGRRRWLGSSALLVAALVAGVSWYAARPDWRVLFSGLDAKDTQQISQELAAAGIPYQMTADGSGIEVDADQVEKARMEVATKGMPQSGRMGFELFDKPNWVGSEFDEKVNYQRAMEGELEHTIETLAAVRSARVHLVLPKDSLFGDVQQMAKASVVLQLRRSVMPPEQVEAIRSLVAGAVENLGTENVTLVDADGRLNLNSPGRGATGGNAERGLEEKLVAMLEPTAGEGNVRASVTMAYDDSSEERTDDVYDPTQVAALSLHKSEQTIGPKQRAGGVPGTASNTPGVAPAGSVQAAAGEKAAGAAAASAAVPPLLQPAATEKGAAAKSAVLPVYPQNGTGGDGETLTEETGSYAVTHHQVHSELGPGRIHRVTAAILVNDRMSLEGAGKLEHAVWKPRTPAEMQTLQQLARAAVGFDTTRGDEVVVENISFSSNAPEAAAPMMEKVMDEARPLLQPGLLRALSISALGLLLVMAVLRPMTQQMMKTLSQTPVLQLTGGGVGQQAMGAGGRGAAGGLGISRPKDTQAVYDHITEQIRKEPAQSTRLLESWISAPVEDDE
jgi:flagellar M-ring protein FliF